MTDLATPVVDDVLRRRLAAAVSERLADERIELGTRGGPPLSAADERQLARRLIADELDDLAATRLSRGIEPLDLAVEAALADAVLDLAVGLGRIQPLLDDPEISDIHIRGCEPVWLKRRDGRRVQGAPVVDSDDELVDLLRRIASRSGKSERRLDAANPRRNRSRPSGSCPTDRASSPPSRSRPVRRP